MTIIGRDKIDRLIKDHAAARSSLQAWLAEANSAHWQTPQDIKNRYRSASFLSDNRVIFNIKGNRFRLVVKVRYQGEIVLVEWVGTHADYDKQSF